MPDRPSPENGDTMVECERCQLSEVKAHRDRLKTENARLRQALREIVELRNPTGMPWGEIMAAQKRIANEALRRG